MKEKKKEKCFALLAKTFAAEENENNNNEVVPVICGGIWHLGGH